MKVAIIGYGFVGKALVDGFSENVETLKVDPKLKVNIFEIKDFQPEIIFICLPTPMSKNSYQDVSIIKEAMIQINKICSKSLVVLKSTVLPDNIQELLLINEDLIYNPEFLREKHAKEDFINSSLIIFGGKKNKCNILANFYSNYTKCVSQKYFFTDGITASLIKYTINSFLATKVSFFNELHKLFIESESTETWEKFVDIIKEDTRIGSSHMQVPGHDGRYGFGGACLPKDSSAFLNYSQKKNNEFSILQSVIKANNKVRAKYNKTQREEEQNINFEGDS